MVTDRISIYYWTFEEVLEAKGINVDNLTQSEDAYDAYAIVEAFLPNATASQVFYDGDKAPLKTLFTLLACRYLTHYFLTTYNDISTDEGKKELERRFLLLCNYSNMQASRVLAEYQAYADVMDALDGKMETTSIGSSRFNDTPQNSGSFADDRHTSTITETETSSTTDAVSKPQLLDDYKNKLYNFLEEWISSFDKFFWEE